MAGGPLRLHRDAPVDVPLQAHVPRGTLLAAVVVLAVAAVLIGGLMYQACSLLRAYPSF